MTCTPQLKLYSGVMTTNQAPATDTLSLVVDAVAYAFQASRAATANLTYASLNGSLEVVWTLATDDGGYVPVDDPTPYWFAEAVDTSYQGCWDGCNGITTVHRPGYCPFVAEHADFDCGCREALASEDAWEADAATWEPAPVDTTGEVVPDDEPF